MIAPGNDIEAGVIAIEDRAAIHVSDWRGRSGRRNVSTRLRRARADDAQAHCEDARRGGRTLGAAGEAQRSEPASVAILVGCLADQATKHFTSTI